MKLFKSALAALLLIALISSCNLFPSTTISECIDSFMADINSTDRSSLYKNLDSDAAMYGGSKTATYWDNNFPVGENYALTRNISGGTVTGTLSSTTTFSGSPIVFVMSEDSENNSVISSITINGTVYFN